MRVATQLDYPSIEASRLPTFLITISKLVLWLSMTLVILYFLFDDTSDQFSAMFYNQGSISSLKLLLFIVLIGCLSALWLARKSFWSRMQADQGNIKAAVSGLVQRFFGMEIILTALLILLAYPLPPMPDLLIFRLLTALLAGFVLIFGRSAARVPALVIGIYGISVLGISGFT